MLGSRYQLGAVLMATNCLLLQHYLYVIEDTLI
jgi:hypothetical protein